jgi:polar amino acid transport system substrate-binding protein
MAVSIRWQRLAMAIVAGFGLTMPASRAALPAAMVKSGTLRFCSSINLPPMEFMNPQTRPEGADIDLGDALAKHLGLKPVYINMPFAGLIPALLADHCDAIISQLFIKKSRLKVIDEIPYMLSHESVLTKPGAPKVPDLEALSGEKVATVTGTTATILLDKANESLKAAGKKPIDLVLFPDNTGALQQLQIGEVAAYGVSYEAGRYYAHKLPSQFALAGPPYFEISTGIGLRKDETGLNQALTAALATLRQNGTYDRIFKKWDLTIDMLPSKG